MRRRFGSILDALLVDAHRKNGFHQMRRSKSGDLYLNVSRVQAAQSFPVDRCADGLALS